MCREDLSDTVNGYNSRLIAVTICTEKSLLFVFKPYGKMARGTSRAQWSYLLILKKNAGNNNWTLIIKKKKVFTLFKMIR